MSGDAKATRPSPIDAVARAGLAGDTTEAAKLSTLREDDSAKKNMALLVQLRWIAVVGQIVTIAVTEAVLEIALPLFWMSAVLASLIVLNIASTIWLARHRSLTETWLALALLFDVGALTAQLYFSGGATNPFTSLYLLQLTLASVLFNARITTAFVLITAVAVVALTFSFRSLALPAGGHEQLLTLYLDGALLGFVLNATLIVVFVTRISRNLRERDARLATMRQQAIEEDHIVRMGLLASGAAHELGTPLSSLSVILGDWRHMPDLMRMSEMARDVDEMERAVVRCKAIVTRILLAAGAPRGEASHVTSTRDFAEGLVAEWKRKRNCDRLTFRSEIADDRRIVSDIALRQVVFNILDNALEVSPDAVTLTVASEPATLRIAVRDRGPGFAPDMLARIGEPYVSSKGRLGGGLGLFLAVNVVRKLGGNVSARNCIEGGAEVVITLPSEALAV